MITRPLVGLNGGLGERELFLVPVGANICRTIVPAEQIKADDDNQRRNYAGKRPVGFRDQIHESTSMARL